MISNFNEQENWEELLETPPEWKFAMNKINKECSYTEEELLNSLQPSTFDFLKEEDEDEDTKKMKKHNEEQKKKNAERGTYVYKIPGFVADSFKFETAYGEVPNRCIMLSNLSPYTTKDDLLYVFNNFGPQESYDFSNISKGVASVVFYNMEDAQAMRVATIYICNQQVMKVFHFLSEKELEKTKNNGTIVVFRVPACIDDQEIHKIFSKFGKIRQVRNTPNKPSQKFIEFYDIRSAEKALDCYNGKPLNKQSKARVSIEFSHPGFKKNIQKYYKNTLPTIERNNRNKNNNKIFS